MVVNKGAFILNVDFWFSESVLSFKCKTKKSLITRQCKYKLNCKLKKCLFQCLVLKSNNQGLI